MSGKKLVGREGRERGDTGYRMYSIIHERETERETDRERERDRQTDSERE